MLKTVMMKRRAKIVIEVVPELKGFKVKCTLSVVDGTMEMVSNDTWVLESGAERMAEEWANLLRV